MTTLTFRRIKQLLSALSAALPFLLLTVSCNHEELVPSSVALKESTLTVTLTGSSGVKSTGSGHGNQADDNFINTLELFVFNAEGPDAGELDAYKKFTASDGLDNLSIKATTGRKTIYAVANSHRSDWDGVVTFNGFQGVTHSLIHDNSKDFIMIGSTEATLQVTTSVSFSISRLVSRVKLNSIRTAFAGSLYAGMKLSNVKAYLINVHGSKNIYDGNVATPVILNRKALVEADAGSCTMPGMLSDVISSQIGDAGYNTPHYFYAYENTLEPETAENRFTRLVIQADLNGKTYYYPVNINREGYGYAPSVGHKGIKRNTSYEMNVTIMRPGSDDPDKPLEFGALTVNLSILNWTVTPVTNPEF